MASSVSVPQLLINEGELGEILRIIDSAKSPKSRIVGKLFGLWRNSLIQPVVQLVTGPGEKAKTSKKKFEPDSGYHHKIKKCLEHDHGLLQIGLWFSGNVDRYPRFKRSEKSPLIPREGQYVFMWVDRSRGNLEIDYQIIDVENNSWRPARLTAADILPDESGFRLLHPILKNINRDAKFPSDVNDQRCHFSRQMLEANDDERPANISPVDAATRANHASFIPATTTPQSSQWYESDGGSSLLRGLVNEFKSADVSVDMSRDSRSHDIQLEIGRTICLHFSADFPTAPMSLTWLNDSSRFTRNPNEICTIIRRRVLDVLSCEAVHSHGHRMSRTTVI